MKAVYLAVALLFALPAMAETVVIDGDTLKVDGKTYRLTIDGIDSFDTPETWKPKCLAERMLGEKATVRLRALLANGYQFHDFQQTDRYGRGLWAVSVGGENVGEILIREGLAVRLKDCPRCKRPDGFKGWCAKSQDQ